MTDDQLNRCDRCSQTFYYDPKHHRCEGEWEAIAGPAPHDPFAGMSWIEECMAKQR